MSQVFPYLYNTMVRSLTVLALTVWYKIIFGLGATIVIYMHGSVYLVLVVERDQTCAVAAALPSQGLRIVRLLFLTFVALQVCSAVFILQDN
jgi:hypothetical protein